MEAETSGTGWSEVESRIVSALAVVRGPVESDVVNYFLLRRGIGCIFSDQIQPSEHKTIPFSKHDTIVTEYAMRYGRADAVVFHSDGSATVIEAKNGDGGYSHVAAGIGQVTLYASQLAMKKVGIHKVRRALLWSSIDAEADIAMSESCEIAGIIPILYGKAKHLLSILVAFEAGLTARGEVFGV